MSSVCILHVLSIAVLLLYACTLSASFENGVNNSRGINYSSENRPWRYFLQPTCTPLSPAEPKGGDDVRVITVLSTTTLSESSC